MYSIDSNSLKHNLVVTLACLKAQWGKLEDRKHLKQAFKKDRNPLSMAFKKDRHPLKKASKR